MTIYNYCSECGNPLTQEDQISCPKCGKLIESKPFSQPMKKLKKKRRLWGNFSWILLLLGSAIGLYALSTPAGSVRIGNILSWDMWMYGYNVYYDMEVGKDIFWTANPDLFAISMGSTIFVVISNILAIVGAVSLSGKKSYGPMLAIISPILLFATTLFYLIAYEVYFQFLLEESFWGLLMPGFAIYGQFIAAGLMILGYIIAHGASKYTIPKGIDGHQENVYQMLKSLIDAKFVTESKQEVLQNKLEIISLRFKGMDILQRKLELLALKEQEYGFFDRVKGEKALEYFHLALELSPKQPVNFSKIDLELATKIFLEQDLKKCIKYFKDIKHHTSNLLSELLIRSSYGRFPSRVGEEWKSRTSSQRSLSYSEFRKQLSSSKTSTDSKHSDKFEERSEISSSVDSQKFPSISELMKGLLSSSSTSDLEPSDKEKKVNSEDKVRNDQENKKT